MTDLPGARRPVVLQVITHLDLGGAEEVAIAMSEQFHAQQAPYDLRFFAVSGVRGTPVGQDMQRRLARIGVPVYSGTRLSLKRGGFLQAAARLAALTWRLRPQVIHLHTEIPELTYALSRGFRGRPADGTGGTGGTGDSPVLTRTLHNTNFWGPWGRLGVQVERHLQGVPLAACSAAALQAMETFRASHGLRALAAGQGRVILNGVSPAAEAKQRHSGGRLQVMFAGRLEPQKGADLLPAIVAQASALGHPPAELNIYGAGSLKADLEHWAAQGAGDWKIHLHPPTPRLRTLMAEADLMLIPSRFEGLCLVAAEALMAGLPVIGARVPGLTEVFPEGYPLLAPTEDTGALGSLLAQVLKEPAHFQGLAEGWAGLTADRFGAARMAREYDDLYQSLLAGRARATEPQRSGAL
ncbi:glycosyltransferase family 4 protein [Deinococcus sp.]|uniref:glycosyltransferase family 4 protein n=1 Tax=Deinococcus sp. TaxID=47478 RepID=UPI003C7A3DD9